MEKIVWEDRYNVQVDEIDRQHRQLVDLMNRLIDVQGKEANDQEIATVLGDMTDYLGYHFDSEEQMMIDYEYPEFESHREEHQAFVAQTAHFITTHQAGGTSLPRDILMFLKEWLIEHIVKTDAVFGEFLKADRSN